MSVFINSNYIHWVPELSAQLKEERTENDMDERSSTPEATSTSSHGKKANAEPDDTLLHAISAIENANKRKRKPSRKASTDCNDVPTGKLQPQPTSGTLRKKRKPKVSKTVLLSFCALSSAHLLAICELCSIFRY